LPRDARACWVLVTLAALPVAARLARRWPGQPIELLGATLSALALGRLALESPEIWLQTSLALALLLALGTGLRSLAPRAALLAFGLGVLAPLLLGLLIASLSDGGKTLLLGGLGDWHLDWSSLRRCAQWLALSLALLHASLPQEPARRQRWLGALSALVLGLLLAPRLVWLVSLVTVPTDLLIWSEPPLLLNLWKLKAGEIFYGPFAGLNSYSYSPALEHLQYGLLRPLGLELSLRAHRVLGVLWQLLAALCLTASLIGFLGKARGVGLALSVACAGLLFTTLLAPHLHPDHLLMLCLGAAFWLVTRQERPEGARLVLLLTLPALATMVKLTGAGIGLGLGLVYLWQRDWRSVGVLMVAGALALATVPLFDATLGNFSAYAIRLQASHPFDVPRALAVWQTPQLACFFVAALVCALRWQRAPRAPATLAALRVIVLTLGIGLLSFVAYAKEGGRDNSLLPFTLGGALALLLALSEASNGLVGQGDVLRGALYPVLAALLALVTPFASPLLGGPRADMVRMHATAVAWLHRSELEHRSVFSASTAAYLSARWRRVPDAAPATISELALAKRPEVGLFEARIRAGYYDTLLLPVSALRVNPTFTQLLPTLQHDYVVVAPPELSGVWPTGFRGYVLAQRRGPRGGTHDIR